METGGDVMDDENDKVSRDVVGVPWSHEFLGPHPATLLTWPGHDMVTSDNIDKEDDDKYFEGTVTEIPLTKIPLGQRYP